MVNDLSKAEPYKNNFVISLVVLFLFGLIMVYSSSYLYAKETFGSSVHLVVKQLIAGSLGILVAYVLAKSKFEFWFKHAYKFHIITAFFVVLTFVDGVGLNFKGASRWLSIAGWNVQPAEFLKFSILLCSTSYFYHYSTMNVSERLKKITIILAPLFIVLMQPDFGTFSICLAVVVYACFISSFSRLWFYGITTFSLAACILVLFSANYRVQRLLTFLNPWEDPQNSGFQIVQSYLAFANGSIWGQGLGNSHEKLFYLPEAYNDFIFSVIGEELGFVGVLFTIIVYLFLLYNGFKVAIKSKKEWAGHFMTATIFAISLQALLNMGVVLGLLPTKGLNLPFISYGGSSLFANFIAVGLFLSAAKLSDQDYFDEQAVFNRKSFFDENKKDFIYQEGIESK